MEQGVVWVTDEAPDVDGTGGAIRQHHLLQAVAERCPVDLLAVAEQLPADVARTARSVRCVPPAPTRPPRARVRTWLDLADPAPEDVRGGRDNRERIQPLVRARTDAAVVLVQHVWLASLVALRRPGERWVLDLHNLPSVKSRHAGETATRWRGHLWGRAEQVKARRHERAAVGAYDAVVVPSDEDAAALGGGSRVHVVGNGVDPRRYAPTPLPAAPRVVFTGHLHYPPNVDGLRWFVEHAWPLVRAAVPGAELAVVGRAPQADVIGLTREPGVTVHADVPRVAPHLAAARVAIVPIRVGSGTRLKALEAMAAGRPVVGTQVGLEGLGIRARTHALVADDAADMARDVVSLLQDDVLARELANAAQSLVADRFDWAELGPRFADVVVPA